MYHDTLIVAQALGHLVPEVFGVPHTEVPRMAELINQKKVQGVLKRSFSSASHHVFWPGVDGYEKRAQEENAWLKNEDAQALFGKPNWILQPYLPLLLTLGEARAFVCNGTLVFTVATAFVEGSNSRFSFGNVEYMRPLANFWYVQ